LQFEPLRQFSNAYQQPKDDTKMKLHDLPKAVQTYFLESYRYYVTYEPNDISDHEYDMLCRAILFELPYYPDEVAQYLDEELLKAGSGFSISLKTYQELGLRL